MSDEMVDQFEDRVRQLVREEIAAYEFKLLNWATTVAISGAVERELAYKEFVNKVLLGKESHEG